MIVHVAVADRDSGHQALSVRQCLLLALYTFRARSVAAWRLCQKVAMDAVANLLPIQARYPGKALWSTPKLHALTFASDGRDARDVSAPHFTVWIFKSFLLPNHSANPVLSVCDPAVEHLQRWSQKAAT